MTKMINNLLAICCALFLPLTAIYAEEADDQAAPLSKSLNIDTSEQEPTAKAKIRILEKFNGQAYDMIIDNAAASPFEDDLNIKLIKCWKKPGKNMITKYIAMVEVEDKDAPDGDRVNKHWLFNHNVELNTFSSYKYHIFLDSCM